ncbi:MAG: SDR family oxidoreductase [Bacteroidetes bacterium]|nr:SDR family oxidoreductase [Bacteroidota bacterium]
MDLRNCRILITGASKGLGKATAEALAAKGCRLILTARNEEPLKALAEKLGAIAVVSDVSKEDDVVKLYDIVQKEWGGLDVLINNAGLARGRDTVDQLKMEDFEFVFGINVFGAAMMAKYAARIFMEQKSGNIINIASTAALKGYSGGGIYSSSKFALRCLTQCWQAELRPYNVRVTEINPTYVPTAFGTPDGVEKQTEENKVAPADIAHTIVAALEMDDRAFIPELTVWATNPW